MKLYQQIKDRQPFFTGWDTKSAVFDSGCPHCAAKLQVKFKEMLDAAWGWQDRIDQRVRESLAEVFGINLSNRSIGSGMPGVVVKTCQDCGAKAYFFFNFLETSNSVYSISLRAAAINESDADAEPKADGDSVTLNTTA